MAELRQLLNDQHQQRAFLEKAAHWVDCLPDDVADEFAELPVEARIVAALWARREYELEQLAIDYRFSSR